MAIMSPGGDYKKLININYDSASINIFIGGHSFFIDQGYYIYGGQQWGFKTKMQNQTYSPTAPTLDSYLMKFNPDNYQQVNCFFYYELDTSVI